MRITTVSPDGKECVKNEIACGEERESMRKMSASRKHVGREREREELAVNPINPLGFSHADAEQKRQRL